MNEEEEELYKILERNLQDSSKEMDESMLNASGGDWQHHMNMHLQGALDSSHEAAKIEISREEDFKPPFNDISLRIGNNNRN
jgi:hypothetical protein